MSGQQLRDEHYSARDTAAANAAANQAVQSASPTPPPPPPPKKLDVGVVAALGVAVGAIGGALATVSAKLAQLVWWQYPLIVIAVILAISLPAVIIAFLKLRQRTLGPILDANGWAINGRVKINIPFGTTLTQRAVLPPNSKRSLEDPYEDKEAARRRRTIVTLIVLLVLFWLLGFAFDVAGGIIHVLLVIAAVLFIVQLITGRRTVV